MKYYINEVPGATNCAYCQKYKWCWGCELRGVSGSGCCNGLHDKIKKDLLTVIMLDNRKYIEVISRDIKINSLLKNKIN
jgi:hypothetical protein